MDVKNVVEKFNELIDFEKTDYTINELVKFLKQASNKTVSKKNSKNLSDEPKEKKPLSAYNIFIREKMEEYKAQDLAPKDKLKKAVEAWNEHKKTVPPS